MANYDQNVLLNLSYSHNFNFTNIVLPNVLSTPSVWEKSCVLGFFGWIKACGNFHEMVQVYRKC